MDEEKLTIAEMLEVAGCDVSECLWRAGKGFCFCPKPDTILDDVELCPRYRPRADREYRRLPHAVQLARYGGTR